MGAQIRVYNTPALIKGVWIFNLEEMAIERIFTETCAKSYRILTLFPWRMAIIMPQDYGPLRHPLAFGPFPVSSVIGPTFLREFLPEHRQTKGTANR